MRSLPLLILVAIAGAAPVGAQVKAAPRKPEPGASLPTAPSMQAAPSASVQPRSRSALERADSAWNEGDRDAARRLYAESLAQDSTLSRAVFRLAQLEPDRSAALALYRRYERLEPRDAWGFMAEGDLLSRMGRPDDALDAYTRAAALAPADRDVALGRARIHDRRGAPDAAMRELAAWTATHQDDGEGWDLLGREALKAGRPRAAERAFANAARHGVRGAADRQARAAALAAPTVEPMAAYQRDSDGNRVSRFGGAIEAMVADGVRLGATGERLTIGDGIVAPTGFAGSVRLGAHATPGVRIDLQGGMLRLQSTTTTTTAPAPLPGNRPAPSVTNTTTWGTPQLDARLRLRAPLDGPSLELRAQRVALGAAPVLVENRVTRTEGRATLELPVGPVRLRGTGRAGRVEALGEEGNARMGADGALVLPLGGQVQLSGQYRWTGFQRASMAGYFAPRRAETIESGLYFETSGDGRVSLAADLGGGVQRVAEQGQNVGSWTRALRAWAYGAVSLAPGSALYGELEAYDAPFAPEGAVTSGSWRFMSLAIGLRWRL